MSEKKLYKLLIKNKLIIGKVHKFVNMIKTIICLPFRQLAFIQSKWQILKLIW